MELKSLRRLLKHWEFHREKLFSVLFFVVSFFAHSEGLLKQAGLLEEGAIKRVVVFAPNFYNGDHLVKFGPMVKQYREVYGPDVELHFFTPRQNIFAKNFAGVTWHPLNEEDFKGAKQGDLKNTAQFLNSQLMPLLDSETLLHNVDYWAVHASAMEGNNIRERRTLSRRINEEVERLASEKRSSLYILDDLYVPDYSTSPPSYKKIVKKGPHFSLNNSAYLKESVMRNRLFGYDIATAAQSPLSSEDLAPMPDFETVKRKYQLSDDYILFNLNASLSKFEIIRNYEKIMKSHLEQLVLAAKKHGTDLVVLHPQELPENALNKVDMEKYNKFRSSFQTYIRHLSEERGVKITSVPAHDFASIHRLATDARVVVTHDTFLAHIANIRRSQKPGKFNGVISFTSERKNVAPWQEARQVAVNGVKLGKRNNESLVYLYHIDAELSGLEDRKFPQRYWFYTDENAVVDHKKKLIQIRSEFFGPEFFLWNLIRKCVNRF